MNHPKILLSPLQITAPLSEAHATILTEEAVSVLGDLARADGVRRITEEQLAKLRNDLGAARYDSGAFGNAWKIFQELMTNRDFPDFLTLVGTSTSIESCARNRPME
jgi:hypothetical protein